MATNDKNPFLVNAMNKQKYDNSKIILSEKQKMEVVQEWISKLTEEQQKEIETYAKEIVANLNSKALAKHPTKKPMLIGVESAKILIVELALFYDSFYGKPK